MISCSIDGSGLRTHEGATLPPPEGGALDLGDLGALSSHSLSQAWRTV